MTKTLEDRVSELENNRLGCVGTIFVTVMVAMFLFGTCIPILRQCRDELDQIEIRLRAVDHKPIDSTPPQKSLWDFERRKGER